MIADVRNREQMLAGHGNLLSPGTPYLGCVAAMSRQATRVWSRSQSWPTHPKA